MVMKSPLSQSSAYQFQSQQCARCRVLVSALLCVGCCVLRTVSTSYADYAAVMLTGYPPIFRLKPVLHRVWANAARGIHLQKYQLICPWVWRVTKLRNCSVVGQAKTRVLLPSVVCGDQGWSASFDGHHHPHPKHRLVHLEVLCPVA
jgi:hypothetical protein